VNVHDSYTCSDSVLRRMSQLALFPGSVVVIE